MIRILPSAVFRLISVLLCSSIRQHLVTAERTTAFPNFMPDFIKRTDTDPETPRPNRGYRPWNWYQVLNASYQQGLLFAGKNEFNWVVTVELIDNEQEKWSIGNLISYSHVLTTCQAISLWQKDPPEIGSVISVEHTVLIDFGTPYLKGDYKRVRDEYDEFMPNFSGAGGIRISRSIILHKRCTPRHPLYDFALIEMSIGIRPLTPLVGYMPILETKPKKIGGKDSLDLTSIIQHRTPCYIASYGKPYYNFAGSDVNIIENFKIKFRVYYVDHDACLLLLQEIISTGHFSGEYTSILLERNIGEKLWCFMPRKKVGSVCDHDRGAPLVCNGFVYGIVVRGVTFQKCNTLVQFPVLVSQVVEYVQELNYLFRTGILIPFTEEEASNSLRPYSNSFLVEAAVLIAFIAFIIK